MSLETSVWEELKNHEDYEICSAYPHQIRNKTTGKIIGESIKNNGYCQVWLDGKHYLKHRLIAIQWIPNDDPALKDKIDHINHNRSDNHLDNLRWVSVSENNFNRSNDNTTFIDELPEFAIAVERYGKHDNIQDLYYCDDVFYVYTGVNYKTLTKRKNSNGYYFIVVKLLNGLKLQIYYSKFKREYGLI